MAKSGFGKFLAVCTIAAASAAGIYYWLNKQDNSFDDDFDDDFDDFDDFDGEDGSDARNYVDLESDASLDREEDAGVEEEVEEGAESDPIDDDTFHVDDETSGEA